MAEIDNFLFDRVAEKLASNKYPATQVGQKELFNDCRNDEDLKNYVFSNQDLVGSHCFGDICLRSTYEHSTYEELNTYYGFKLKFPKYKKPLKSNNKDQIIDNLKNYVNESKLPVFLPCKKHLEDRLKKQYIQTRNELISRRYSPTNYKNLFTWILFFSPLVAIFIYSFFIFDPGMKTIVSCYEGYLGEERCRYVEEQRSYIWNVIMFFFIGSIGYAITLLFDNDK
tara:strand:- start:109 stop:786 length:678 start_codon:yes stop_codon:yes gene_type:complete